MSKRTAAVIVDPISPKMKVKVDSKSKLSSTTIPHIVTLFNEVNKPIGWIFEGFFEGREYLKKLSNKNESVTVIGETEFKPFSNLKTKWMPESMLGDHLWGIQIESYDGSKEDDTMRWFPVEQEGVAIAWAKKIACAMIKAEERPGFRFHPAIEKRDRDVFINACKRHNNVQHHRHHQHDAAAMSSNTSGIVLLNY